MSTVLPKKPTFLPEPAANTIARPSIFAGIGVPLVLMTWALSFAAIGSILLFYGVFAIIVGLFLSDVLPIAVGIFAGGVLCLVITAAFSSWALARINGQNQCAPKVFQLMGPKSGRRVNATVRVAVPGKVHPLGPIHSGYCGRFRCKEFTADVMLTVVGSSQLVAGECGCVQLAMASVSEHEHDLQAGLEFEIVGTGDQIICRGQVDSLSQDPAATGPGMSGDAKPIGRLSRFVKACLATGFVVVMVLLALTVLFIALGIVVSGWENTYERMSFWEATYYYL